MLTHILRHYCCHRILVLRSDSLNHERLLLYAKDLFGFEDQAQLNKLNCAMLSRSSQIPSAYTNKHASMLVVEF